MANHNLHPPLPVPGNNFDRLRGGDPSVQPEELRRDLLADEYTYREAAETAITLEHTAAYDPPSAERDRMSETLRGALDAPVESTFVERPLSQTEQLARVKAEQAFRKDWLEFSERTWSNNYEEWAAEKPSGSGDTNLTLTVRQLGAYLQDYPQFASIIHESITKDREAVSESWDPLTTETHHGFSFDGDAEATPIKRELTANALGHLSVKEDDANLNLFHTERAERDTGDPDRRITAAASEHSAAKGEHAKAQTFHGTDERRLARLKIFESKILSLPSYVPELTEDRQEKLERDYQDTRNSALRRLAAGVEQLADSEDVDRMEFSEVLRHAELSLEALRRDVENLEMDLPPKGHPEYEARKKQFGIANRAYLELTRNKAMTLAGKRETDTYLLGHLAPDFEKSFVFNAGREPYAFEDDGLGMTATDRDGNTVVIYAGGITKRTVEDPDTGESATNYYKPDGTKITELDEQPDKLELPRYQGSRRTVGRFALTGRLRRNTNDTPPSLGELYDAYNKALFEKAGPGAVSRGLLVTPDNPAANEEARNRAKDLSLELQRKQAVETDPAKKAEMRADLMRIEWRIGLIEGRAYDEKEDDYDVTIMRDGSVVKYLAKDERVRIFPDGTWTQVESTNTGELQFGRRFRKDGTPI